jgi:hypothetical protein
MMRTTMDNKESLKLIWKNYIYEAYYDEEDEDVDNDNDDVEEDDNEGYPINKLTQDNEHTYQILQGVKYRLGYHGKDEVVSVAQIEATPENTFYPQHIQKYVEYIKNGGIIDSFPVSVSPLAYNLEGMLDFIDDNWYGTDYTKDLDDEVLLDSEFLNNLSGNLYELYMDTDEGEKYHIYNRINKNARTLEQVFPADNRTPEEIQLMKELSSVFEFFDEHKEYTLTDMNHRFEAVKELGATAVWVDVVN